MKELLKKYQFWLITSIETIATAISLIAIDYWYDYHIPRILDSFSFPYFGFIMLGIGLYSFFLIFTKINIVAIVGNSLVWSYVSVSTMIDLFNPQRPMLGLTLVLAIVSLIVCVRIIANAYLFSVEN